MSMTAERSGKRSPLAAAMVLAFAWPLTATASARILVTTCDDPGVGGLRAAVASASSGDSIDLTKLSCSKITLSKGAIKVTQSSLYFTGRGQTIDGDGKGRVFAHTGTGTLKFSSLKIVNGTFESPTQPDGGCVVSSGSVVLTSSVVSGCRLNSSGTAYARGGGLFTAGGLTMTRSTISGNMATADTSSPLGGGAYVGGDLVASYSTIENNAVLPGSGTDSRSRGGGLRTHRAVDIRHSTIAGNYAQIAAGAYFGFASPYTGTIANSTISSNVAGLAAGGIYSVIPLIVQNVTIAFNSAEILVGGIGTNQPIDIEDSIISGNTIGDEEEDLGGNFDYDVAGSHNVIPVSDLTEPADTIHTCPKLGPLAFNGGPTKTHDLGAGSPAIDAGLFPLDATTDQRGSGFPRAFNQPDIGAIEMQGAPSSRIFVERIRNGVRSLKTIHISQRRPDPSKRLAKMLSLSPCHSNEPMSVDV